MASLSASGTWLVIDEYVAAFESARASRPNVDLGEFLPEREHPQYLGVLGELVRVDLELAWEQGQATRLESYCQRYPALLEDRQRLAEVAFEEYRLRRQAGEDPPLDEYRRRFQIDTSTWHGQSVAAGFPQVGSTFGDFRLLHELGRGAFARVYLAQQSRLANRLVALKVSAESPRESQAGESRAGESQTLAQLQHTNIVPVYSAHHQGPWQALCMPYFGATTLGDVVLGLRRRESLPSHGRELIDTVIARRSATLPLSGPASDSATATPGTQAESNGKPSPGAFPAGEHVKLFEPLEKLSYVEAVLWIAARVADGLAHAHARGIVHQDLKPANILLADDGRPMLLDFNLSTDTKRKVESSDVVLGGTLPYMAPEQLQALEQGKSLAEPRADLYALGVILFELLTGRNPFPHPDGATRGALAKMREARSGDVPRLRTWNRAVSPAVESLVRKCLAPELDQRYASAEELRDDLERQLAHRPLRHATNPSLGERASKWVRRHQWVTSTAGLLTITAAAGLVVAGLWIARERRLDYLEAMSARRQTAKDLDDITFLLTQPGAADAERREATERWQAVAERYDSDDPAGNPTNALLIRSLPAADQLSLTEELARAHTTWALHFRRRAESSPSNSPARTTLQDAAERELALAARVFPLSPSRFWLDERAALTTLIGGKQSSLARIKFVHGDASHETVRDRCFKAMEQLHDGEADLARTALREITRQSPDEPLAWTYLGHAHHALGAYADALACYSTSLALTPESPWAWRMRGSANHKVGRFADALADHDRALAIRPKDHLMRFNRALTLLSLKRPAEAVDDLTVLLAAGEPSPARVLCVRARAYRAWGKRQAAQDDLAVAMTAEAREPEDLVIRGLARIDAKDDAAGALADFDAALAIEPRYRDALEDKAHVLSEKLGRTAEAIDVLNRTIELYPSYVKARAGRGVLLARQGEHERAQIDAKAALELDDSAQFRYQVAGIYALNSANEPDDRRMALRLLGSALGEGYGYNLLDKDPELDPLREDPEFRRLAEAAATVRRPLAAPKNNE